MPSTSAQEAGMTIRLAIRNWGMTARLCTIVLFVAVLFIAIPKLPLIAW